VVEEVRAVERIDILLTGTGDLSCSLELRAKQKHRKLEEAIARVAAAGKRQGKYLGRPAQSPEQVKPYMEQDFQLFQAPTDLGLFNAGERRYLEAL
jgi:2-keto-3-deoxy-L-rhamnonate aldolase RhmA